MTQPDVTHSVEKLAARNEELETRYMHLQRTVEVLNEVVIEQGRKIDQLEHKLAIFARQFRLQADRDYQSPSLEDEKPPHY